MGGLTRGEEANKTALHQGRILDQEGEHTPQHMVVRDALGLGGKVRQSGIQQAEDNWQRNRDEKRLELVAIVTDLTVLQANGHPLHIFV